MKSFQKILDIIEIRYSQTDFNINSLLDECNICYSVLYETFINNLNISPHRYLENKRLEKSIFLFAENNQSLLKIIKESGYNNTRTFRIACKKRFAKTAQEIKRELLNSKQKDIIVVNYFNILWNKSNDNFR